MHMIKVVGVYLIGYVQLSKGGGGGGHINSPPFQLFPVQKKKNDDDPNRGLLV
jgi:hypothetical protein